MATDDTILKDFGERLSHHRLNRNQTQAAVAREAGIAVRTVSKAENGHLIDTRSLVRMLRALGLLDNLDAFIPAPRISPIALSEARGHVRERASGYRGRARPENKPAGEWTWPDEER
jgi:transcriptional regulator with XRE-family HTH domain